MLCYESFLFLTQKKWSHDFFWVVYMMKYVWEGKYNTNNCEIYSNQIWKILIEIICFILEYYNIVDIKKMYRQKYLKINSDLGQRIILNWFFMNHIIPRINGGLFYMRCLSFSGLCLVKKTGIFILYSQSNNFQYDI